jgi:hypothetical protein
MFRPPRPAQLALALVIAIFVTLAVAVAVLTPPWEANDEPHHVMNVQIVAAGRMYRIDPAIGMESHQAPLYYVLLAGWQRALGIEPRTLDATPSGSSANGLFRHDTPTDGADQRLATFLRMPGAAFGVLTLLLTAATAQLVTRDPWTPVVAAAVVAGVPKFVFLSGVVNNDTLGALVGALTTFVALHLVLRPPAGTRDRLIACGMLGVCVGAAVLTKVTATTIALPAIVAAMATAPAAGRALLQVAALTVGVVLVAGQWLVFNLLTYGDPLAMRATTDYLRAAIPDLFHGRSFLDRVLFDVPRGVWKSFWYASGWNQFSWPDWAYFPFWAGLATALVRWLQPVDPGLAIPRRAVMVLVSAVAAGIVSILIAGVITSQEQARIGFIGLSALAVLVAVGLERWRAPVPLRFALPALGLAGTLIAIRQDIVTIYF